MYVTGDSNNNHIIFFFTVVLVILFSSLSLMRGNLFSVDYHTYAEYFHDVSQGNFSSVRIYDVGFIFITKILSLLNFDQYLLVLTFISLIIKSLSVTKISIKSSLLFVFIYCSSTLFLHELIQTRLSLGIALFYLATYYYLKRNKLATLVLLCVSISFHFSIVFVALILFVRNRKLIIGLSFLIFILLQLGILNGVISFLSLFNESIRLYTKDIQPVSYLGFELIFNSHKVLLPLFSLFVFLFFSRKSEMTAYEYSIFKINTNFMICSVLYFIICSAMFSNVFGARMSEIFLLFMPLYSAIFIKNKWFERDFLAIALSLVSCAGYSYIYIYTFIN